MSGHKILRSCICVAVLSLLPGVAQGAIWTCFPSLKQLNSSPEKCRCGTDECARYSPTAASACNMTCSSEEI